MTKRSGTKSCRHPRARGSRKKISPGAVLDRIEHVLRTDSAAGLLVEVCLSTDEAYGIFLDVSRQWRAEPFAPWDTKFVLNKMDGLLGGDDPSPYKVTRLRQDLARTLNDCGFKEEHDLLCFLFSYKDPRNADGQPSGKSWQSKPRIEFRISSDQALRQFGTTQHFPIWRSTLSKLNIWKDGFEAYRILFHECGHAIHFMNMKESRWLSRIASTIPSFYTEAVAQFFEFLPIDRGWMQTNTDLSDIEIDRKRVLQTLKKLYSLRENVAFALTELLIRTLIVGFEDVWPIMAQRHLHPGIDFNDLGNAREYLTRFLHHQNSAFNVVLSMCIASHIRAYVAGAPGESVYHKTAKRKLSTFLRPNGVVHWQEVIKKASKRDFDATILGKEFTKTLTDN
jgi:hypothetical protein